MKLRSWLVPTTTVFLFALVFSGRVLTEEGAGPVGEVPAPEGSAQPMAAVPAPEGSAQSTAVVPATAGPAKPTAAVPAGEGAAQPMATVPAPEGAEQPTAAAPVPEAGEQPVVEAQAPDTASLPAAVEQSSASADDQAEKQGAVPKLSLPVPPRSLQTIVDERRDLLRKRRSSQMDAYSRGYMPPGYSAYYDAVERQRDAMRMMYRWQRDYDRLQHDSWMDAMCPWSKPQRDWVRQRSFQTQMEQLDWQERWRPYPYRQPFALGGPIYP